MNNELFNRCSELFKNREFNELENLLFNEENINIKNDNNLNLLRGVYYLNINKFYEASNTLWDSLLLDPYNSLMISNLELLPDYYKNKFMSIYIDYDNDIALKFINNMVLNKNIILYVDNNNFKKINNINLNIYNNERVDLCIRIRNQTDFKLQENAKKTLIMILNCNNILNVNMVYSNNIYFMSFNENIKNMLQSNTIDFGDDIFNVIDDGIDYTEHKLLTDFEKKVIKRKLNLNNEIIYLVRNDCNLEPVINEFNKVYLFNKNIKLLIETDKEIYNDLEYVKNIDRITNNIYNIIDCYITMNDDNILVRSYGKRVISGIDKLLERIIDVIEDNEIDYRDIGYYYDNYNFKRVTDDIVNGYLYGPFFLEVLINCIDKNANKILQHDESCLMIIRNYLLKVINYENIYIRLEHRLIGKLVNLNYYIEVFNIEKYETNNILKNYIFNNYEKLLDYKINAIYKSLLLDNMIKSIETITRREDVYNSICNLVDKYDFNDYYCMIPNTYFMSTYLSKELSKKTKSMINRNIQNAYNKNNINFRSYPMEMNGKYNMAVVGISGDFKGNAVYKFIRQQIISLSKYFRIHVLIEDGGENLEINEELRPYVSKVYSIKLNCPLNEFRDFYNGNLDITTKIDNFDLIKKNNYLICYYLVMGCTISSIYLSNLQIAPYQMSGYGHPISSFGSKNNYFIMSPDIENIDKIKDNYTEEPLLVNKLTTNPITPSFDVINTEKKYNHICLSCTFKKLTPYFMKMLDDVAVLWNNTNNEKLVYHFFTGPCGFVMDSTTMLGNIVDSKNYKYSMEYSVKTFDDYMTAKNMCYLGFDSYPYAGFTTILENLRLRIPTIVYEGDEVVNRFPSYFYKNMGLDELIVKSYEEYIDLAIRLLTDKEYYNILKNKINNIDVDKYLEDIYDEESLVNSFVGLINQYENI